MHLLTGFLPALKRRLLTVPFGRALLEVMIVQVVVIVVYLLASKQFGILSTDSGSAIGELAAFYCLCTLFWLVLRWQLRPQRRSRWRQVMAEAAMSGLLFFELILSTSVLLALAYAFSLIHDENWQDVSLGIVLTALGTAFVFLLFRICLRLFLFWNRLRSTRLRWSLTHAHLMIVVIGAGVISIPFAFIILIVNHNPFNILAFLFGMLVTTAIAIVCVLPPSALFSFFFTRSLTRRIERLTNATSALRGGDYSVRVAVDGQDEIARLQADFNAMAIELERTMHELKTERDNVATLLDARRELIANVSHELRTPVATVRSYMESALLNWEDQPPPTLKQDMQIMEQQAIRLQSLINDLFTLARAEVGRLEMRCEPTNIELLVKRVTETISPVAWRGSRVEILAEFSLVEPTFPQALVDANRLEQILHNLIHNGIRHTSPGGIIIVSVSARPQTIVLQVKDTGEGIAAEELPRIWERFYRSESSRAGSGTGLGLTIVKELTEAMRGTVQAESVLGQGSCFTIYLPRVVVPASQSYSSISRMQTAPLPLP